MAKVVGNVYFNKTAIKNGQVKVPKAALAVAPGYFYQGPSRHFGHPNANKKK